MSSAFRRRGFTIFEALIALAILFLLILVVGDAVERMLHHAATTVGRADQSRTASELAIRMNEEARSSTAIFLPATDVLGDDNSGGAVHEIDFFRRLSAGGDTYVAYRFDQPTGTVVRYEYTLNAGSIAIAHSDQLADGISGLTAQRLTAGSLADVVSPASVSDVSLLYGTPGVVGGNDVIVAAIQTAGSGGVPSTTISVHLASRSAPTSLAILTPAHAPPPVGGGPITIPFIIRNVPFHPPHGPWHSGSPGQEGGAGGSGMHLPSVGGSLSAYGGDSSFSFLDFFAVYPQAESGTYVYNDSNGKQVTVTVVCDGVPCPRFKPLPTSGSPPSPTGGVGFDAVP